MATIAPSTYEVHINLVDADPPIWRTILVPSSIMLADLHNVIQTVMGWTNSHLHEFQAGKRRFGPPDPYGDGFGGKLYDEADYDLSDLLNKPNRSIMYEYDFGDCWKHQLTLVTIRPEPCELIRCLGGERAGPPEDCGGVHGYARLLQVIADPTDEDHQHLTEWFASMTPSGHRPDVFPIHQVNAALAEGLDALEDSMWAVDDEDWDELPEDPKHLQFPSVGGLAASAMPVGPRKLFGRNEPCPCGSGLKFKRCCGK